MINIHEARKLLEVITSNTPESKKILSSLSYELLDKLDLAVYTEIRDREKLEDSKD